MHFISYASYNLLQWQPGLQHREGLVMPVKDVELGDRDMCPSCLSAPFLILSDAKIHKLYVGKEKN